MAFSLLTNNTLFKTFGEIFETNKLLPLTLAVMHHNISFSPIFDLTYSENSSQNPEKSWI